ncbi:myosin light chain kinase, smooth muscle-like protein [Sarcoptes scabiei]|uniref:Myosin light chain kinase, smooth muscle-like protein n=1 Tax=Sarcoptes scabiei TaxID=52283 RepID=A0A132AD14_SARSC|nr:myosin light chain kinase, smooth muscle-like protein [Sarcoptes scabiei]
MIYVDESEPEGESEPPFQPRNVKVKRTNPTSEYVLGEELGRGKFGIVRRCHEKSTNKKLAAKFINTTCPQDRKDVEREVDIIIEGGELFERVIDDDFVLTEKACAIFVRQICEGLDYIHSKSIIHLDMKPENVLCVTRTGNRIKLIDFGFARKYDKGLQVMFGTPEFAAPEVINFEDVGYTTDMWAVGVITYVLLFPIRLSGLSPFMGDSDLETMANVTRAEFDFNDESFDPISEQAKDFISKLLVKDKK